MIPKSSPILLLSVLTACAVAPRASSAALDAAFPVAPRGETLASPAGAALPAPQEPTAAHAELPLLHDPAFRQRLAESYLATSDIEPPLTPSERKSLFGIMDKIAADQLDDAARLLLAARGPAASAVFDFTLGNVRFQQDQLDGAVEAYDTAVARFPRFRRAWANLGQAQFRRNDFAAAAQAMARVVELGGNDATTFGLLGIAHTRCENYIAAESAFRMAAMMAPGTIDWQMGLAETFFRQERFAEAVALFGALLRKQPDRADLWLAQGEAQARLGNGMEAAKNFEVVDQLGGATPDCLYNLGDIYANQSLWGLAVSSYQRAMQRSKEGTAERPLRAAKFLVGNGAHAEARVLVDTIETGFADRLAEGDRKDLLRLRSRLAAADGATDEEVRVLEQIVAMDPLDGDALILLGQYRSKQGDTERAIFYYERAAGLPAFEADAKVRQAQLLAGQGRYQEALPLLRRAQALKPRDNVADYLQQVERVAQGR